MINGIPARIWEGESESGIKVHCYITRIAIDEKETRVEEFARELWEMEARADDLDVDETDLGSCCACGKTGADVRAIVMLDKRGPKPGHGWGCAQCGLPMDGAVYVLCDACFNAKAEAKFVCVGYPKENVRIPIAEITEPFDHDMSKHPEAEMFAAAQREH